MKTRKPAVATRGSIKMADIARLAGVSASTVSRALSGHPAIPVATRESVQSIAQEHGYVVNRSAQNLRQSQTKTVAVAVPLGHERDQLISDPFFLRLFGHVADEISLRGYDILLVREPAPDAQWFPRLIRSQRADGFIVVGQSDQHAALNSVAHDFLPMVVFGAEMPGQEYCSIGSDNLEGGRLATEHLIRSGHSQIMFLGPADLPQVDLRLAGYRQAVRDNGLSIDEHLVCPAHFTGNSARECVQDALNNGHVFDAIFAASDGIAVNAIQALESAGLRCPDDIAVVGFDNTEIALQSRPRLTTVRQDFPAMASCLVDLLFKRMAGEPTGSAMLPVSLEIRESAP